MRQKAAFPYQNDNDFKCCMCCHVRTGTLLLGLFHLLVDLLVIGVFVVAMIHPDILRPKEGLTVDTDAIHIEKNTWQEYSPFSSKSWGKEDICIGFVITMCCLLVVMLLLYGTARSRPVLLMPFFCLQVFDFCLTCLTVIGSFSYTPNIKIWLQEQGLTRFPWMQNVMNMDSQYLMLLVVTFFALAISVKAYFIGVVWSCYKYLQMRSTNVVRQYSLDPDTEMLLPPKYEDVVNMPAGTPTPPPPYPESN